MNLSNLNSTDRVTLEGNEVKKWTPLKDKGANEITHYGLAVERPDGTGVDFRKVTTVELSHLWDTGRLVIERGFYTVARQFYSAMHGPDFISASQKKRDRAELAEFRARRICDYHKQGMPLTREGLGEWRAQLQREDEEYQCRRFHGTDKPNSTQKFVRLPCNGTLLLHGRMLKRAGSSECFLQNRKQDTDADQEAELHAFEHLNFITNILRQYANGTPDPENETICATPSKGFVARLAQDAASQRREQEIANGHPYPIEVMSIRTYERWIDMYLDPWTTVMKRDGWAAAVKKFGIHEAVEQVSTPGHLVQVDAWKMHVITLATTREEWMQMTEEERANVKRVRRWVVVYIDVATRCILGYSICRNPNQQASLEGLRMCFEDKTYLLRDAGLKDQTWSYRCPIHHIAADSGSEFGKSPFGGGFFPTACRRVGATLQNTTAGVSWLRPHIERFFRTCDLKMFQHLPGSTRSGPHKLADRKPGEEACIMDDELDQLFALMIAEYHMTPHRMLGGRTPDTVWKELTA